MRAFYSLPLAAWPDPGDPPHAQEDPALAAALGPLRWLARPSQCVECGRTAKTVYLLSAVDPNQAITDAGGKRLGRRLSELTAAAAKHFTMTRVMRSVMGPNGKAAPIELAVLSTAVLDSDRILEGPPLLRMIFAGDDPANLL